MKKFDDIVKAIGLSASSTVVRGGARDNIVYEAVLDSTGSTVAAVRIDVDHKLQGSLAKDGWDPPGPGAGGGQDGGRNGGRGGLIRLSSDRVVAVADSCRYSVACRWSLTVQALTSDGMDLVFDNDSDLVTTWVVKMATVMMNDFRDYLE